MDCETFTLRGKPIVPGEHTLQLPIGECYSRPTDQRWLLMAKNETHVLVRAWGRSETQVFKNSDVEILWQE